MPAKRRRTPRLTKDEWDAIYSACDFVLAGMDPWESEAEGDDESPTLKAVRSAVAKMDECEF